MPKTIVLRDVPNDQVAQTKREFELAGCTVTVDEGPTTSTLTIVCPDTSADAHAAAASAHASAASAHASAASAHAAAAGGDSEG